MNWHTIEGSSLLLDGGAMYGHLPKVIWEKWSPPDELNRIRTTCRTLFVQTASGQNVLFDVGVGDFFEPKQRLRYGITQSTLIQRLEMHGVNENDVHSIILSHLHFDHAGGLLSPYEEGPPRLLFPNAKYYLSKQHWERAKCPHQRERASFIPILHQLLENSGRLILIEEEGHKDLDFGVTFSLSHGHTIGLLISELEIEGKPLVYASDLIPGVSWLNLAIATGYDRYAELVTQEKEELLKKVAAKEGRIVFTHDTQVPCAYIHQDFNHGRLSFYHS